MILNKKTLTEIYSKDSKERLSKELKKYFRESEYADKNRSFFLKQGLLLYLSLINAEKQSLNEDLFLYLVHSKGEHFLSQEILEILMTATYCNNRKILDYTFNRKISPSILNEVFVNYYNFLNTCNILLQDKSMVREFFLDYRREHDITSHSYTNKLHSCVNAYLDNFMTQEECSKLLGNALKNRSYFSIDIAWFSYLVALVLLNAKRKSDRKQTPLVAEVNVHHEVLTTLASNFVDVAERSDLDDTLKEEYGRIIKKVLFLKDCEV